MRTCKAIFRITGISGVSPAQREEIIQCVQYNMNEAKELLAMKYGVDKSHISLISLKPF